MSRSTSSYSAELAYVQLRSCLVNLPPSLVDTLGNSEIPVQNVVVELQVKASSAKKNSTSSEAPNRSVFVGWSGVGSRRKQNALDPMISRLGASDKPAGIVEIDGAFARVLELSEGQQVGVFLHTEPEIVHTVNIEPLTPGDWELIELHATFLETNLQSQVRALPNPAFGGNKSIQSYHHPITLHLSPTSTANILVTSFIPAISSDLPFVRLAPDAEVIVAPKSRARTTRGQKHENRSTTGVSQGSASAKSGTGSMRSRPRKSVSDRQVSFFRVINRCVVPDDDISLPQLEHGDALVLWIEGSTFNTNFPRGTEWVSVSLVNPASLSQSIPPEKLQKLQAQENGPSGKQASEIVSRIKPYKELLGSHHALLSPLLCSVLGLRSKVGDVIRVEAAPAATLTNTIKKLTIFPFKSDIPQTNGSLRLGGESKSEKTDLSNTIKAIYGTAHGNKLLAGPLTDGMILPASESMQEFGGGMLKLDPPALNPDGKQTQPRWISGPENMAIDVLDNVLDPIQLQQEFSTIDEFPVVQYDDLVGISDIVNRVQAHLTKRSPILLEGGAGAGKSSVASLVAHTLQSKHLFYTSYFNSRRMIGDETRVSTIREAFKEVFLRAWWATRLGGQALIVFDDLDRLCPSEQELQVGGENARTRQLSEIFCAMFHQYCSGNSSIVLLTTAVGKESLHEILRGGHIFREGIELKTPNKAKRRDILEMLLRTDAKSKTPYLGDDGRHLRTHSRASDLEEDEPEEQKPFFVVDPNVDFLDVAGRTDGFMPKDMALLVARVRSESLIRSTLQQDTTEMISIIRDDFDKALEGFVPASLRNVTLQSSSTTFNAIGGLEETRKTLLETLQYPTTYAPIFAKCPLRLRSGLLLYGYPGCGKTLLASAVAGECGLNFISVKGPEILNKYIGASEKSVRDLFDRAEAAKPCVLFFDEFDSIAPKRGHDSTGVTDRVVNQLLTQMDGAEGLTGVYVLAATSRPDLIDPALLRPGRLDKSLLCDMPSVHDRLGILRALCKELKVEKSILEDSRQRQNLQEVARSTEGFSGADLQAIVYNAHLEAVHEALGSSKAEAKTDKTSGSRVRGQSQKEILSFRFKDGRDLVKGDGSAVSWSKSKEQQHRTVLLGKIEAAKRAKRKEKALKRGHADQNSDRFYQRDANPEPVIHWKHLQASISSTHKSISDNERRKLEGIYREFLVGRTGDMPNGQASTEVGARSSLM